MAVEARLITAEELLRWPEDQMRHELVRGELRTMAPAGSEHSGVTSRFDRSLGSYVQVNKLGEVLTGEPGFQLTTNPDTVRAPDVALVRQERVPASGLPRGYWPGAPDLAVEVISPHDLYTEVEEKVAEWLEHGSRLVFVVNPRRRTVAVHRPGEPVRMLTADDVLDGQDVVPGWTLPVSDLFSQR
jgi:Uma2 family endonuclease